MGYSPPPVKPKLGAGGAGVSPLAFPINTEKINSGQNSEQFEIERIKNSGKIFTDDKKTVLKKL